MLERAKRSKVRKNRLRRDPRLARRRWLGRLLLGFRALAAAALVLGASALFMAGYAALTSADYFRARAIKVAGNRRLTEAQVLSQAAVRPGDNLLALNLKLVRKRLLEHAWIEDARVTREIPKTLRIQVREHVPLARIGWGRQFLLDEGGRIFKSAGPDDPHDLPLIGGVAIEEVGTGSTPPGPALEAALQVLLLGREPDSPLALADLDRLQVDPELGVTAVLKEGRGAVKLGLDRYEAKYGRLKQLRLHLQTGDNPHDFEMADLTDPDRVVVRLAATGSAAESGRDSAANKKIKKL